MGSIWGIGMAMIASLLRLVGGLRERDAERRAEVERLIGEAEDILLFGSAAEATPRLLAAERLLDPLDLERTRFLRTRVQLGHGRAARAAGRGDDSREHFESALARLEGAADSDLTRTLRASAHCDLALLGFAASDEELMREHEGPAFELEPGIRDARVRVALTWLALRLGEMEHIHGRWMEARGRFERAVNIGEGVLPPGSAESGPTREKDLAIWAEGRATASAAALAMAAVLSSIGDREGGLPWFERAERLLDGPDHPSVRVARSRALLERGRAEPVDWLGDPGHRRETLESAVHEGLAAGVAPGRLAAGEAEIELGAQSAALGDSNQATLHYERADELVRELDDDDGVVLGIRALLSAGRAHQSRGEDGRPTDLLRRAMDRGRTHRHPEARRLAAIAAQGLHECLLDDGHLAEARNVLETLAALVPGLPAASRPIISAGLAYRRGQQWLHEREWEKAARILEVAEARALMLQDPEAPNLARAAATGRGIAALESGSPGDAREHFLRALGQPEHPGVPQDVLVERSWAAVRLGQALLRLGEETEAIQRLEGAQREGLQSGHSAGRCAAAMAAFLEAELPWQSIEVRERLYETAARLGRLSGIARGRDLAEAAEARLRELES
jgi:tetratricopeptide (TPR) repeat protein